MIYNAANRKDIRRAEKDANHVERSRLDVIRHLCDDTAGRRYIWDRLSAAHIFTSSFSPDALAMAFAEGERNIGLQLLNDIMLACPDHFLLMMREHNERSTLSQQPGSQNGIGGADRPDPDAIGGFYDDSDDGSSPA